MPDVNTLSVECSDQFSRVHDASTADTGNTIGMEAVGRSTDPFKIVSAGLGRERAVNRIFYAGILQLTE